MYRSPSRLAEIVLHGQPDPKAIGRTLRGLRDRFAKTRNEVTKASGILPGNVSRLESGYGDREPTLGLMARYLEAMGCELVLVVRPRRAHGPLPSPAAKLDDLPTP